MGNFIILNKKSNITIDKWNKLLKESKYANSFNTPEMFDLFESVPHYAPEIIAVTDEEDSVKALVVGVVQKEGGGLKGFFSRRAIVFGGPVFDENDKYVEKYLDILLRELNIRLKSKSIYIEFRNFNDYGKYKKIFKKHGYEFKSHLNFHVDCSSEAEMFKRISSSKRRQIKNSLKNGAEIIIAKSESEIAQFYDMLKLLYKEKIKKPLPPKEYFINFFRNPALGKYFLIKYMNKIIGGIMCPILDNRVIYEAYVVGEDRKFKNIYPSILATYAAMDYAAKNGIKIFDFMGAGSADQSYGVREFKSKFGGELNYFGRFERINNRILFIFGRFGLKFYRGIKN